MSARDQQPHDWLATAAQWPLAFAQVREDPWVDLALLADAPPDSTVVMIASGGCTAAVLARHPAVARLVLVDCNRAQLGITRLKLHLLETSNPEQRKQLLGHADQGREERLTQLQQHLDTLQLSRQLFGSPLAVAAVGLDYAGRYEQLFAALSRALVTAPQYNAHLEAVLRTAAPARQSHLLRQSELQPWLDGVCADILALPHLQVLFGDLATRNPARPFHQHFAAQLGWALQHLPAADNPYLWQMLRGTPAPNAAAPWLDLPAGPLHCRCSYLPTDMASALRQQHQARLVHLSNILDWLDPAAAHQTLQAAADALAPGGRIVVRQLNSTLDLPALGAAAGLQHDSAGSAELAERDRSFFYRRLYIGVKPCW